MWLFSVFKPLFSNMEKYHVLQIIGEGSFGKVYKGRRKFTSQVRVWMRVKSDQKS